MALNELLLAYWRPLYVFMRRKGLDEAAAQDAVQELLLNLVEKDFVEGLDPNRGRLRSFLMTAASNHLVNRHEKAVAAKRGGGAAHVPLDFDAAERLVAASVAAPAESAFDREWAASVMERALTKLEAEFRSGERKGPFEVVLRFFKPDGAPPAYKEIAKQHAMSIPQLKAFLHRARVRFRELVRDEILETCTPEEAEDEMSSLVRLLG